MNTPFYIARKYFFSSKKSSFINVISILSMLAVAFGTASLVIVLSVFNGLGDVIRSLYSTFDPELKVSPVSGKTFIADSLFTEKIQSVDDIAGYSEVIEDYAFASYKDKQQIVRLKGVPSDYLKWNPLDTVLLYGSFDLKQQQKNMAVIGQGVEYNLGYPSYDELKPIVLMYPYRTGKVSAPGSQVNHVPVFVSGVFQLEQQFDDRYIYTNLESAMNLFGYYQERSALEVAVQEGSTIDEVKKRLKNTLGDAFLVQDSDEQHASLLKAIKIEKLFVILTFIVVLLVASVNIFFSLYMLEIEKRKDISVLLTLGASKQSVFRIFLFEGFIIAFSGAFIGLLLGFIICRAQQLFGFVKMDMQTALIHAYPVKMDWTDFVLTGGIIFILTIIASVFPARKSTKNDIKLHL